MRSEYERLNMYKVSSKPKEHCDLFLGSLVLGAAVLLVRS